MGKVKLPPPPSPPPYRLGCLLFEAIPIWPCRNIDIISISVGAHFNWLGETRVMYPTQLTIQVVCTHTSMHDFAHVALCLYRRKEGGKNLQKGKYLKFPLLFPTSKVFCFHLFFFVACSLVTSILICLCNNSDDVCRCDMLGLPTYLTDVYFFIFANEGNKENKQRKNLTTFFLGKK